MNVNIYKATIEVGGKTEPLTARIAKQFPIRSTGRIGRYDLALHGKAPEAICKVNAATVDKDLKGWLLLVEDAEAGLAWNYPVLMPNGMGMDRYPDRKGDDLESIPTVIL